MMTWIGLDPRFDPEVLGYLPSFLNDSDPRPAKEQLDANYRHGGGWQPLPGWKLDPRTLTLRYPGDPPYEPIAMTVLHGDRIVFYPYSQVMILAPDGGYEVARMD
jgi:hypothetical protein